MRVSTLGEICDRTNGIIQTGPFGSQLHQSDYRSEGIPVVMPQDIVGNKISEQKISYIDESLARKLGRHLLAKGDIVFPRRGEIRKRAITEKEQEGYFCGTGCLKISIPPTEIVPRWLFYYLDQEHVVKWIEGKAVGATMLNLNTGILRALPIEYPSLLDQQRIVEALSTYDTLIATNQRSIALLEEAARRLYREWFVHLRFPGHEQVPVRDGVPVGWEICTLDNALFLQRGFDLPNNSRIAGDIPIYASTGINGFHNEAKASAPGIVTGRSGTLGKVYYIAKDFWPLNTSLWVKEFRRASPLFAYFLLSELELDNFNSGASVPTLDRKTAHQIPILLPQPHLIAQFDNFVQPLFDQMELLAEQNHHLAQARDLLLPKLMSGQLDVSIIPLPEEAAA